MPTKTRNYKKEYAKYQSENFGNIKGPVDNFPNENAQGFT